MSIETIGVDTSTTLSTQITAPVSTNTKGAWTQLVASTANNATGIVIFVLGGGADGDALLDIGTGASSSEVAVISNLHFRPQNTSFNRAGIYYFPLNIASGTRVSARYQATSTSCTCFVSAYLATGPSSNLWGASAITSYGANTADSGATAVDPGGTANTKGSYVQITASTTDDCDWLWLVCGESNHNQTNTAWWMIDVATGAGGAEVIAINNIVAHCHSGLDFIDTYVIGPFPVTIASGTRIAVRAQCLTNNATDRLIDIGIITANTTAAGSGGASFHASFGG